MIKKKKVLQGKVYSDKMDKTRVVLVERTVKHPLYGKITKKSTKYMVHDETNQSKVGDKVQIAYLKPLSKSKSWEVLTVIEKASILDRGETRK
ncbi:MAG: 30S ribosomal protein S17 [bacterium]|nr:30S ribosomal protein S17 [bacterium]